MSHLESLARIFVHKFMTKEVQLGFKIAAPTVLRKLLERLGSLCYQTWMHFIKHSPDKLVEKRLCTPLDVSDKL